MVEQVLETVQDAAKFNEKIEELKNDENWNKDDYKYAVQRVDNTVDQIEQIIIDRQSEIQQVKQDLEYLKKDIGEKRLNKLRKKTLNGDEETYNAYVWQIDKKDRRLRDLERKIKEWKTAQQELESIKAEQLLGILDNMGELKELLLDGVGDVAQVMADEQLEAIRQEQEYERESLKKDMGSMLRTVAYNVDGIEPEQIDMQEMKIKGGKETDESDDREPSDKYKLKGESIEDSKTILEEMIDDIGQDTLENMSQADIARKTDISQAGLINKVKSVVEEYPEFNYEVFGVTITTPTQ